MGLHQGVFYPPTGPGEPWNGLISVGEEDESEISTTYIDGVKNYQRRRRGYFSGNIQAYTYPDNFYSDILIRRKTPSFGLSYRTNDKIHLVYNVLLAPEQQSHTQKSTDSFSWSFSTLPIDMPDNTLGSHIIIDTNIAYSSTIEDLENVLYGTEAENARLPTPFEIFDIFEENSILRVIDHGDGTFTVEGPDSAIQMLDSTTFEITWPSAVYIDAVSYTIHSL
jgi:hypothetical protein